MRKDLEQLRNGFRLIGISRAIFIDDKANVNVNEIVQQFLQGIHDGDGFLIVDTMEELGLDMDELLEEITEGNAPPSELITILRKQFAQLFNSEIHYLVEVCKKVFDDVAIFERIPSELSVGSESILFLDYQLAEGPRASEELIESLSNTDTTSPLSIVFISSKNSFIIGQDNVDMLVPLDKSKYFRHLRTMQNEINYKNSLYDYIHKPLLREENEAIGQLKSLIGNFYGGYKFYTLLELMEDALQENSVRVINRFRLLNARSIKDILNRKISKEGQSGSLFILEWLSRHISKSIMQDLKTTKDIQVVLNEIETWPQPHNELHEDTALRDLQRFEMWDTMVSNRHEPVDFGDIFEIDHNGLKVRALLLTQTCTLMVRGDGERDGEVVTLALENSKKRTRQSGIPISDWNGEQLVFDLDTTVTYPVEVLDLTSLSVMGDAFLHFGEKDGKIILPDGPVSWSKGYANMINRLRKSLVKNLEKVDDLYYSNGMWTPYKYKTPSGNESHVYEFPIRRVARLDQQYALYILQKAHAWWGRIGLPISVNFMDEFLTIEGTMIVNGLQFSESFFVRRSPQNKIIEIAVSLHSFREKIQQIYEHTEFWIYLESALQQTKLVNFHYASTEDAQMLIHGGTSGTNLEELKRQGIVFKVDKVEINKDIIMCEVFIWMFERFRLFNMDITRAVSKKQVLRGDFQIEVEADCILQSSYAEHFNLSEEQTSVIISTATKDFVFTPSGSTLSIGLTALEESYQTVAASSSEDL